MPRCGRKNVLLSSCHSQGLIKILNLDARPVIQIKGFLNFRCWNLSIADPKPTLARMPRCGMKNALLSWPRANKMFSANAIYQLISSTLLQMTRHEQASGNHYILALEKQAFVFQTSFQCNITFQKHLGNNWKRYLQFATHQWIQSTTLVSRISVLPE